MLFGLNTAPQLKGTVMTTITATTPRHHHPASDAERRSSRRRPGNRRPGARAFALGTALALLCAAIAWGAVAVLHHPGAHPTASATSATTPPAATAAGTAAAPSAGPAAGAPTGTPNPSDQDVVALQRDLGQLNYYESTVDGVYGPATVAAITDFQRANGLTPDGVAGPATMAKIQQQLVTGDNQMGPSGPPAPATPATPAGGTADHGGQANGHSGTTTTGQSGTATGGAAVDTTTGAGA
jgi:Putative peptidoglycan binding domain